MKGIKLSWIVVFLYLFVPSAMAGLKVIGDKIDFGSLPNTTPSSMATFSFKLLNDGQAPVTVVELRPSCGCIRLNETVAQVIQPGKTIEVPFDLDLMSDAGQIREEIVVKTDESPTSFYRILVRGTVVKLVSLKPANLMFGGILPNETRRQTVDLILENEMPQFQITKVTMSDGASYVATLETIKHGKSYRVHVDSVASSELGPKESVITLETNDKTIPTLRIPVSGRILPEIIANPSRIVLRSTNDPNVTQTRSVRIKSAAGTAFDVVSAKVSSKAEGNVSVAVKVTKLGDDDYRVDIQNIRTAELQDASLSIETTHPRVKTLLIPLEVNSAK